jgi:hypothetical protein
MEFVIYKRALRRHHFARIKRKRLSYFGGYIKTLPPEEQATHLGMVARSGKLCSCWMCGNSRHYDGIPTIQERRFFQDA